MFYLKFLLYLIFFSFSAQSTEGIGDNEESQFIEKDASKPAPETTSANLCQQNLEEEQCGDTIKTTNDIYQVQKTFTQEIINDCESDCSLPHLSHIPQEERTSCCEFPTHFWYIKGASQFHQG